MRGKYLSVDGDYVNSRVTCGIKIVSVCEETNLENARKGFMRQWRRRKKALGVLSKYAKRCKSVNISENTNMNKKKNLDSY